MNKRLLFFRFGNNFSLIWLLSKEGDIVRNVEMVRKVCSMNKMHLFYEAFSYSVLMLNSFVMTEAPWLSVGKQCVPDISNSHDELNEWYEIFTV